MRTYAHSHFEGVSLAPDGVELSLDYFDWDQGGTRLCFHYVFRPDAPLRLFTGYADDGDRRAQPIIADEIPVHVVSDARGWLEVQLSAARSQEKTQLCDRLTEHLDSLGKLKI